MKPYNVNLIRSIIRKGVRIESSVMVIINARTEQEAASLASYPGWIVNYVLERIEFETLGD